MLDRESFQKKILAINSEEGFNELALQLFYYQSAFNPIYKYYLELIGKDVATITHYNEIPCLPVSFFKTQRVSTISQPAFEKHTASITFKSSGTTEDIRSTHYVYDRHWYEQVIEHTFQRFFGDIKDYIIVAYLPSYYDNKESSLLYMVNHFIRRSGHALSGYYELSDKGIEEVLETCKKQGKKAWIIGVTYALLDWAEIYPISLPDEQVVVLETGGMKGRRTEMVRAALHEKLKKGLGVSKIYSEYGMCELLSQAYSFEKEQFEHVPWLRLGLRELNDPFHSLKEGSGVIRIVDLANIDSCAFIETQDLGYLDAGGKLKIVGRIDHSDIRGCNLLYQN